MTTDGEVLPKTETYNFVTAAGTIVNVNKTTGEHTVVATVLTEDSESTYFDYSNNSYDILLFPILERANIASIEVHNKNGTFTAMKVIKESDGETVEKFVLKSRPDLVISDTVLFATLVHCTGYTRTLMRLDTADVQRLGYAEYGLPDDTDDAEVYYIITDMDGNSHKVVIGDEIPSGAGYYARYADRDAVYVLRELSESEYSSTFAKALFGRAEDYTPATDTSHKLETGNYYDVTNFRVYNTENRTSPLVDFSYSGSIDKRKDTFYSDIPYVSHGSLKGYTIDHYAVDDCLYALYELQPAYVVALGTADLEGSVNDWLKQYGLDTDSYAYRVSFILNLARTYNTSTGEDVISKENGQEYHEILVSEKQENGYHYLYNLCYLWDPETGSYSKMAEGYNMVVAVTPSQIDFLKWDLSKWVDYNIFGGNIAYISEIGINVAAGQSTFPEGFSKILYFDNSETIKYLEENKTDTLTIGSDNLVVRDSSGKVLDITQIRYFYTSLLYTMLNGTSSLSEERKEEHRESGTEGAMLTISIKYVPLIFDNATGKYVESGEVVTREYCFYRDYSTPRESYTTVNGVGEFFTLRTRVEKLINDINRLYTGETIKPQDNY
jgi:hypothetical protein